MSRPKPYQPTAEEQALHQLALLQCAHMEGDSDHRHGRNFAERRYTQPNLQDAYARGFKQQELPCHT